MTRDQDSAIRPDLPQDLDVPAGVTLPLEGAGRDRARTAAADPARGGEDPQEAAHRLPPMTAVPVRGWAIWILIQTRFLEFTRKPAAVFWTYVFPLVMVVVLGLAFRSQPNQPLAVGVVAGPAAQELSDLLVQDPGLSVQVEEAAESLRLLRSGKLAAIVRRAQPSDGATADGLPFTIVFDESRPGSRLAELSIREGFRRGQGLSDPIPAQSLALAEPGGRYVDFLVPGLIGMTLLGGGLWGVGYAIVDMRIRKLLKRYLATPMRKSDFLLGIVFSRLLFMFPQVLLILAFSHWFFGVVVYGSLVAVAGLVLLGGIQFAGVGLLVACRAKTMETMSGLINLVMLPMWTLSGIFFSYENFPEFLHWPIRMLPLTPLLDALRAVMLEGLPLSACWIELLLMGGWTIGTFSVALLYFRWSEH